MKKTRYRALQDLVRQYGDETVRFFESVHATGPVILEAYRAYLGAPDGAVNGIPPFGDFEPRVPYREAMFSTYGTPVLYLEPVFMGISTEIAETASASAIWVRTVIEFRPCSDGLEVLAGERQRRVLLVPGSTGGLEQLCDAIHEDVREAFTLELDEARGQVRIGFVQPGPSHGDRA